MSDTQTASNNTKILLIVLAAVVALALVFFFVVSPLLSGGDDLVDSPVVGDRGASAESESPSAPEAEAEPEPEPLPQTFEVFSARDPFHQLVQPSIGTGTSAGDTSSTGGTSTSGGTQTSGTSVSGTNIRLVDVYTDNGVEKVQVTVNGTGYDVAEGETFASNFRVLDISGSCATFLYGDNRFVLCKGDEIRK